MADNLQELLNRIDQMHSMLADASHYELIGVVPNESSEQITRAYRALARDWHVDRFSNVDLGDRREKVQEIFAALNQAHRVLTNKEMRLDYDMELDPNHEGPDLGSILEAETAFRQGKNMLAQGSMAGAAEKFKFALELQPDEVEYRAHVLYCEFAAMKKNKDGVVQNQERAGQIFAKLDEYNKATPEKDWLLTFLGNIALGLGKQNSARSLYAEALMANPQNHEAKRQQRLVRMRDKKAKEPKGFIGKFLAKFK